MWENQGKKFISIQRSFRDQEGCRSVQMEVPCCFCQEESTVPVAGYMIAKRGVEIEATYFHAPPYTSERAKEKVVDLARLVSAYAGPIKLHVVNFTDIQLAIYEKMPA